MYKKNYCEEEGIECENHMILAQPEHDSSAICYGLIILGSDRITKIASYDCTT